MKIKSYLILIFVMILLVNGCRNVIEIRTYEDLIQSKEIEIVTSDSSVYTTHAFSVNDSSIILSGTVTRNYVSAGFKGELHYKDIVYIQTGDEEILPPYIKVAAAVIYTIGNSKVLGSDGISTIVKFAIPPGTGSCPFLYSWDGSSYHLEGETFGTSLGKALENETYVVLPSLKPENGIIRIKFSNERPETHFFNQIKLYAVRTLPDQTVIIDNENRIRVVHTPENISRAIDAEGTDITNLVENNDNLYWRSDLSSATASHNFEDVIYCELYPKVVTDSISFIITARNTTISGIVFQSLYEQLGSRDFAAFSRAAETDKELIEILKKILSNSALKIETWDGSGWILQGLVYPEANMVDFKKLITLHRTGHNSEVVKVRLRALTDVWKINSLKYSEESFPPSGLIEPELASCNKKFENLRSTDENYIKIIPGEDITLEYKQPQKVTEKLTYIASAKGYLYEYIINPGGENIAGLEKVNPDFPRLELIKEMLGNSSILYSYIYTKWKINRYLN